MVPTMKHKEDDHLKSSKVTQSKEGRHMSDPEKAHPTRDCVIVA